TEIVSVVAGIFDPLHASVELRPAITGTLSLVILGRPFALLFFRRETTLFGAADAPVRVETLQDEFGRRHPQRVRFVYAQSQRPDFFEQSLDRAKLLQHAGRILGLVELERAAQIEPLHDPRDVDAFVVLVVNLADSQADQ